MRSFAPRVAVTFAFAYVLALGAAFAPGASAKTSYPNFTAPVVDAANVVPDDAEQRISADLLDYQRRSGNQIAVAVVKTTGDESLEDYSIDLARRWGVGEKDKDSGVLVLIAYDDRKLRIEVGRGLEGDLTDLESGRIIREQMVGRMREGDVGGAIEAATQSIRVALGDTSATAPAPLVEGPAEEEGFPLAALPVLIFVGISVISSFGRRRRRFGWMTPLVYGSVFGGSGSSSSGSSGGGFSGGGGGSFGGGGASGSW